MVKPDWGAVAVVYDRMQGLGLLQCRASPGTITGHIMCIAVFARAARFVTVDFDLSKFIDEYCELKNIDRKALFSAIWLSRRRAGALDPDPMMLLEQLSQT